jgi:hypothetical protein
MIGGALATAGNLVFSGADDGHFYAFDARSGKILWKPDLGLPFGAAPIAYAVNGTEYIAVAAGGSDIAAIANIPTGGTLVVFKLGGKAVHKLPVVNAGSVPTSNELPSLKGLTRINPWMYVNAAKQHVVIKVVAAATPNNSGFNFNGYARCGQTALLQVQVPRVGVHGLLPLGLRVPHLAAQQGDQLAGRLKPGALVLIEQRDRQLAPPCSAAAERLCSSSSARPSARLDQRRHRAVYRPSLTRPGTRVAMSDRAGRLAAPTPARSAPCS